MLKPSDVSSAVEAEARRFLTFRVDDRRYAIPAQDVSEVVRVPPVARVPQAPAGLLGIANLRGSVLPLVSLRVLLGRAEADALPTARAIVVDGAAPVALAVDTVEALVTVDADQVESRQAELAAESGERLQGAFQVSGDQEAFKILDVQSLLGTVFVQRPRREQTSRFDLVTGEIESADDCRRLVTFEVAGQEFALELDAVQEIIPASETRTALPRTESLVLGVVSYRDTLLPLLSLRGLLGFAPAAAPDERERVLVVTVKGVLVGLVADGTRAILAADPALVEPIPPVLAARTGGEARIKAIYRSDAGRRLVSILAPEQLFQEDVMQRLKAEQEPSRPQPAEAGQAQDAERQFLVFRLCNDEFGLPIEAVDEVARVPETITRVPRAPKFLEGVVNLRGEVLPVVDQRRRFGMPVLEGGAGRRLVVVRTERHRAGLIVDSVSDVLRSSRAAIAPAPDLTGETMPLVNGIINLESVGRIVLVLDPAELLSRAEQGLLDKFEAGVERADV
jgi:purine-binding chemotaxis protein CheW